MASDTPIRYVDALSIEVGNGSAHLRISSLYLAYAAILHSFRRPGLSRGGQLGGFKFASAAFSSRVSS